MGFSIISDPVEPDLRGFAISPLMPANCFTCCLLPPSTGIEHHINRVKPLLICRHLADERFSNTSVYAAPDINHLVIALVIGN